MDTRTSGDRKTEIADSDIKGLTADSRQVAQGFLFAALPGTDLDGRAFIDQAIERGAVAVLAPTDTELDARAHPGVALITDADPRARLAQMAARFYGQQPKWVTAVTGTNGKSSVADMARQIWQILGYKAASIGTLGLRTTEGRVAPPGLTTLDPVALHEQLAGLAQDGITHVALEASSHGLDQARLDAVEIRAAAFTMLGRDHMDYHRSAEKYFAAKTHLFDAILPTGGAAVLNADIIEFKELARIARARGQRIVSYGRSGTDLKLVRTEPLADGQDIEIEIDGNTHEFRLPLIGAFQAHNLLAALGLVLANGTDREGSLSALNRVVGVPGRMEQVARTPNGAGIFVDYAHTHDALAAALTAIRPHATGAVHVVFGAGGDRDPGKRTLMGHAAHSLADHVTVTDDNPRSEDPAVIREQILTSCPNADEIGDRAAAIAAAIVRLAPGDVLVIAGKGHETGQIVGDKIIPFDDGEVVREIVRGPDQESGAAS
ncbi:MAG: UDP-N-acetylmuramoyl-L-alanyl-D-glutamate--2,6-diaminopimelate ligase [Alphaproteobacteria bacterium]|nr:UDP-N-acetylmuramoyl-L-alanyl-D-glutamate--2,6-diaminopimelate ligase [Alphaproteobacteria bacterium]